ncbi:MAG: helix-turn-helix domain-containing protein [Micromonosporaceae bacterium]|nr:helix-turn-helix domain-containing protein [Micromonosporaceae bacterium]
MTHNRCTTVARWPGTRVRLVARPAMWKDPPIVAQKRHRLAERRKAVGLSQERLAEAIGVDRSTVVRWERGETHPHPWHRPRLANALTVSIEELAGLLGEPLWAAGPKSAPPPASGVAAGGSAPVRAPGGAGAPVRAPAPATAAPARPPPAAATSPRPPATAAPARPPPATAAPARPPPATAAPARPPPAQKTSGPAAPEPGHPRAEDLTRELRGRLLVRGLTGGLEPTARYPAAVESQARAAHEAYQRADYRGAVRMLPTLITDAEQLVRRASTRREEHHAHRLLAISFLAASKVATKLGDGVLGWVAADRAMTSALAAGDRAVSAVGAYQVARALLQAPDRLDDAAEVLAAAVAELERPAGSERQRPAGADGPAELSVRGALLLLAAVVAARRNLPTEASARLAAAAELTARLRRDDNQLWTGFGPTNVRIHALTVAVALHKPQRAIEIAETLDTSALPAALVSRRAQVHVDLAAAFSQTTAGYSSALLHLLEAEQIAPELVRVSHAARTQVAELLRHERRASMPGLRRLAARAGVLT